jgi:hypothetical protein
VEVKSWAITLAILGLLLLCDLYVNYKSKDSLMALADDLQEIKAQLDKAKDEIVSKIGDLEIALASAGEQSADVQDAVGALKGVAQALDDVVPDPVEAPAEEAVDEFGSPEIAPES